MCIINTDKDAKYTIIVFDKNDHSICSMDFISISTVCRFLQDFDFDYAECDVFKKDDLSYIDPKLLLEIWRGK